MLDSGTRVADAFACLFCNESLPALIGKSVIRHWRSERACPLTSDESATRSVRPRSSNERETTKELQGETRGQMSSRRTRTLTDYHRAALRHKLLLVAPALVLVAAVGAALWKLPN